MKRLCVYGLTLMLFVACDGLKSPTDPVVNHNQQPPCIPSDRCDNEGPLPDTQTHAVLVAARDEFRRLSPQLEGRVNWNDLPPVTWGTGEPGWVWSGSEWCGGYTDKRGIHISVAQAWRREGLIRHEMCHWFYCAAGDCDYFHRLFYIN